MTGGRLVFVGDVHLDRDDPVLPRFLAFLDRLEGSAARLVLIGDLFNLWLGRRELEQAHHRAVVERLERLRRAGVGVRYVEGNRDYRIARAYAGSAFDDATDGSLTESCGDLTVAAVHGDLANVADRRYRAWRTLSRSAPVWRLFNLLPRGPRRRLADALEARMRDTNLAYKRDFPEAAIRAYAERFFSRWAERLVLGHFHAERTLEVPGETGRRIFVLPLWSESPRHLEFRADGTGGFVDSEG